LPRFNVKSRTTTLHTHLTVIFQDNLGKVSWHQNVSILDFTGAKDDGSGGDNWKYKTCKDTVKLSPPTKNNKLTRRIEKNSLSCYFIMPPPPRRGH